MIAVMGAQLINQRSNLVHLPFSLYACCALGLYILCYLPFPLILAPVFGALAVALLITARPVGCRWPHFLAGFILATLLIFCSFLAQLSTPLAAGCIALLTAILVTVPVYSHSRWKEVLAYGTVTAIFSLAVLGLLLLSHA